MLQWIQQDRAGFGLDFGIFNHLVSIEIVGANTALYRFELLNDVDLTIAVQVANDGSFMQYAKARNRSPGRILLPYALRVNVSLNRASYGQLTEGM